LRGEALEVAVGKAREKVLRVLGKDAFKGDAHALLVLVYSDPRQPIELRIDAAKAAIGYEKPKLASIDAKVDVLTEVMLTEDERRERARKAIIEAFAERPLVTEGKVIEHEPIHPQPGNGTVDSDTGS
jgi:hypothetical protein